MDQFDQIREDARQAVARLRAMGPPKKPPRAKPVTKPPTVDFDDVSRVARRRRDAVAVLLNVLAQYGGDPDAEREPPDWFLRVRQVLETAHSDYDQQAATSSELPRADPIDQFFDGLGPKRRKRSRFDDEPPDPE